MKIRQTCIVIAMGGRALYTPPLYFFGWGEFHILDISSYLSRYTPAKRTMEYEYG
jgi:hypothetical protein